MKKLIAALLLVSIPLCVDAFPARETSINLFTLCDSLAMETPIIRPFTRADKSKYSVKTLDYGMTIGIERTPKGRIWNCFVGGGDNADAFFLLNWSDDGGKKWTDVKFIIDPHSDGHPLKRRTIVGQLWTDPKGRLWLFMDQAMTYYDGRSGNWYSICENPDDANPVWSTPKYIGYGCTLNKPTVMSTGEWCLPVSLWVRKRINNGKEDGWTESPLVEMHHELDSVRGAHVFVSEDEGQNWEDRSFKLFPEPTFDEHQFVELPDGRWWMTTRTGIGICQCFSSDKGYTWTDPELFQPHIDSRHFMILLASGNILLVRHGMTDEKTNKRSHMRAFISSDNGNTWQGGLLIDERAGVSYPTGFQDEEGYVTISYDYERTKCGELYLAKFNEEDILACAIISKKGYLGKMFYKPGRVGHSKANLNKWK